VTDDELVPFAERLGLPARDLKPPAQSYLEDLWHSQYVEAITEDEVRLQADRADKRRRVTQAIACAVLEGRDLTIAGATSAQLRGLLQDVREELELYARVFGVDPTEPLERLAEVALRSVTR
jgi:hypothetical protein